MMPVAAAIGPPGLLNPGQTVLLDTSLPPPPGAHFQPVTSQPTPQAITLDGGLMSVQPTTSFVLSQPPQGPPPGSLVLTHQPELASGTIVLSQPVVSGPPPDSYVLAPPGVTAPGSFVLTQPAPAPGTLVLSQPGTGPFALRHQQVLLQTTMEPPPTMAGVSQAPELGLQAGPMFSQPSSTRQESQGVSIYQIPSGSQLTVVQPPPGQMHESGGSAGPSAIYTLSLPPQLSSSSATPSTSCHQQNSPSLSATIHETASGGGGGSRQRTGPRKRRFMETDDVDYGNLLGYQHGPPHLMNTLTVSSASDGSSSLTATSKPTTETSSSTPQSTDMRDVTNGGVAPPGVGGGQQVSFGQHQNIDSIDGNNMEESTNTAGLIDGTCRSATDPVPPPVSQYSGKPQMYIVSHEQSLTGQAPAPMAVHDGSQPPPQYFVQHVITDPGNIYSQPSFIYHQPAGLPTIAYGQFSVAPDAAGAVAAPQFSGVLGGQPSTVYVQHDSAAQPGASGIATAAHHYMFPPASSMAPQLPSMMFSPRPAASYAMTSSVSSLMQPGTVPSMVTSLAPPPPPPFHAAPGVIGNGPSGPAGAATQPMSYWMALN